MNNRTPFACKTWQKYLGIDVAFRGEKGQYAGVCSIACHFQDMVNPQVNSVQ